MIPRNEALTETLMQFFGSAALPDYGKIRGALDRSPFTALREQLTARYDFADCTDYNYDLGWAWYVGTAPTDGVRLRLSFVGPFAVMLDKSRKFVEPDNEIADIVRSAGFHFYDLETLREPVTIWEPEVKGTTYEFLFEFDMDPI